MNQKPRDGRSVIAQGWCFFCFFPLGVKLILNLPSSLLVFWGESADSTLLLLLGQIFAVLGDFLLPISFCLGLCLLARSYFAPAPAGVRTLLLLVAIFSQLIPTLFGMGGAYLLTVLGMADQTASAFRAAFPYYALGVFAEYGIELLWIGIFSLLCRRLSAGGERAEDRKHSHYRIAMQIAVAERMLLVATVRLHNILGQIGTLREVLVASGSGIVSQSGISALLSLVILPALYGIIGLLGILFCGKSYAVGIAAKEKHEKNVS